jgi:hypothetical protein
VADLSVRATGAGATREAPAAPGPDPALLDPGHQPTRTPDFVLGALALAAWLPPRFPQFLSLGLVALAGFIVLASLRRPARPLVGLRWLPSALVALLAWTALVSMVSADDSLYGWQKRELRLALVAVYLLVLLTGRIHYASVVRGMAAGLALNAVLFFAGAAPAPYGEFLSGFILDKNQAGLAYSVVGLLLAGLVSSRRRMVLILAVSAALVWTTGSRTSLAALTCGIAWFLLRPRLSRAGRLVLALALAGFITVLENDYARIGVFADRGGTDWFRARIDAASKMKLESAPWQGSGLGEAWVHLESGNFLFHNAYWGALVEGGWVLLGAYLVVTVVLAIGPLRPGPPVGPWASGAEAANVVVLVCALRLGEVFGATTAVTALGAGLLAHSAHRALQQASGTASGSPASTG